MLGSAIYVTDSDAGTITVIDPDTLEIRARIEAEPGLGPMRFNEEGRWGLVVNASADKVFVIDYWGTPYEPMENELKHCVFFKFKDDAPPAEVKKVEEAFAVQI